MNVKTLTWKVKFFDRQLAFSCYYKHDPKAHKFRSYGTEKLIHLEAGGIFFDKKTRGHCLREILLYQKSRGNGLGELITNLKIKGKPGRGNNNKKNPLNIF